MLHDKQTGAMPVAIDNDLVRLALNAVSLSLHVTAAHARHQLQCAEQQWDHVVNATRDVKRAFGAECTVLSKEPPVHVYRAAARAKIAVMEHMKTMCDAASLDDLFNTGRAVHAVLSETGITLDMLSATAVDPSNRGEIDRLMALQVAVARETNVRIITSRRAFCRAHARVFNTGMQVLADADRFVESAVQQQ